MTTQLPRRSVDVYYSGFTTVEVEAPDKGEALDKGREEAGRRLQQAIVVDPDGAAAELVNSLEPWKECDTTEQI